MVGTNTATVGRWERGISLPYPIHREKLCEVFAKDVRTLGLIEEEEQKPARPSGPSTSPAHLSFIFDPAIPIQPTETSTLIGRDDLLAQLKEQVCAGGALAISALHGLPGVGKTTLALTLTYDYELQKHFRDGILWVGLGIDPNVQELLGHWGALLGLTANEISHIKNNAEWARTLRTLIGMRHMLLVIDDAWTIEEALDFQVGGPNCAYIVTTRFPQIGLQIAAHRTTTVAELTEEDGIALLARFVPRLVEQDPIRAQLLVHSVGALPLALVLMGKYLRAHAYNEQPRRLHNAIQYVSDARQRLHLSEPPGPAHPHPSLAYGTSLSLQSMIALSDERLDPPTQIMLRTLSVFPPKPNSFTEEAAVTISNQPVETLDKLCDAGLLESCGSGRYMLHQTISDYAYTQLGTYDPIAYQRMIDYMVGYVETHLLYHHLDEAQASREQ